MLFRRAALAAAAILVLGLSPIAALGQVKGPVASNQPGLSTTVKIIIGTAPQGRNLAYYSCANTNASVAFVQVFDAATATVITLGTTPPKMSLPVQSSGITGLVLGTSFLNGIKVAATTTATGNTATGTALDCTFGFN